MPWRQLRVRADGRSGRQLAYVSAPAAAIPAAACPVGRAGGRGAAAAGLPAGLSYLAWFALVPGMLLIHRAPSAREAGIRGWWLGFGYFAAAEYWLAPQIGPAVILVAVVFGLLLRPFGIMIWTLLRPPVSVLRALATLAVVPSYWLVTEWLRSWQALGGPWAVLGASQWQHPAVLALASVGGVWLVSFAIAAVNVTILIAIVSGRRMSRLVAAAAAAAVLVAGPVAFALTSPAPTAGATTIALVAAGSGEQPGAPRRRQPAAHRQPEPQRWPRSRGQPEPGAAGPDRLGESSAAFHLKAGPGAAAPASRSVSAANGAQTSVNQDSAARREAEPKVAVLVGPTGIAGTVQRRPGWSRSASTSRSARRCPWLTKISKAAVGEDGAGRRGAHPARRRAGRAKRLTIGPLICFESAFPDMSRVDTDHGAPGDRLPDGPTRRSRARARWPSTRRSGRCAPPRPAVRWCRPR